MWPAYDSRFRESGLGIELDEEALAKLEDPDWNFPERYDADDGAVKDW